MRRTYVEEDCSSTTVTKCYPCARGFYTETINSLYKCRVCKECSPNKNQREMHNCSAKQDTVCECVAGYYCNTASCEHCQSATKCPPGKGVKVQATRMNDTICASCDKGTYSNETDYSPCKTHTRCEDLGRLLETPGTPTTDAICGNFKTHCPWILPAGLWSGFVLTALIVFCLTCLWAKRKSYRTGVTASANVPVTLTEMVSVPISPLELPFKPTEQNGHCQESCTMETCKLHLFNPDDKEICCSTQHSMDSVSSHPITPLKVSVSFAESGHIIRNAGYCTGNFLRSHSEPQEDEWCGT
ncbi:hypothetical protein PAMP_002955 [Pampus punctatissimus]